MAGEEEAKRCNQELTGAADSLNRAIKGIAAVELMQATKPISESLVSGVLAKTMGGTSFAPLVERQLAISGAIAQSFAPLVERQLAISAISGAIAQSFAPLAERQLAISGAIAQTFAPLAERHRLLSGVITRSPGLTSFSRAVARIVRSAELTSLLSRKFSETLAPFREKDQFEEAEWFPHNTFPRHLLNWNGHEAYSMRLS